MSRGDGRVAAWRFTIGDLIANGVISVHKDGNHGSNYPRVEDFGETGVLFLTAKQVSDSGRVDFGSAPRLKHERARGFTFGFIQTDDVLLSHNATVGRVAVVPELSEPALIGTSLTHFRLDKNRLLPQYLAAYLRGRDFQNQLASVMSQTTRNQVPITSQRNLSVVVPPISIQQGVARVLSSLDDKIDLNRQINQTLEDMAQALFESWFVDFDPMKAKVAARREGRDPLRAAMTAISGKADADLDALPTEDYERLAATAALFPDVMQESELGEIPGGWDVISLHSTAEYMNGLPFGSIDFTEDAGAPPVIKIAELKQGVHNGTKRTWKQVDPRYLVQPGDVLYSWSGSPETSLEVFRWFGEIGVLNQHIFKLTFHNLGQREFTYYLLKKYRDVLVETAKQKQTTGLGHITVADMKRIKVVRPKNAELATLTEQLREIYSATAVNEQQSMTLSTLRDTLLPKLLSGELSVDAFAEGVTTK